MRTDETIYLPQANGRNESFHVWTIDSIRYYNHSAILELPPNPTFLMSAPLGTRAGYFDVHKYQSNFLIDWLEFNGYVQNTIGWKGEVGKQFEVIINCQGLKQHLIRITFKDHNFPTHTQMFHRDFNKHFVPDLENHGEYHRKEEHAIHIAQVAAKYNI